MKARSFAAFDIDGTLVRWQLYHAVADELAKQGFISIKIYSEIRDARMDWKHRARPEAFKEYETRLVKAYEALLQQLTVEEFEAAVKTVFDEYKDQVYTYTRDLIHRLKKQGYLLFAISNSQAEVVQKIADYYGFDDFEGAVYERKGSRFTGNVTVHLTDKDAVLQQLVAKHAASYSGSIAVGDSASDVSMLKVAEQPIAFNPERKLFDEAQSRGWKIVIERKNVMYELEPQDGQYLLA